MRRADAVVPIVAMGNVASIDDVKVRDLPFAGSVIFRTSHTNPPAATKGELASVP